MTRKPCMQLSSYRTKMEPLTHMAPLKVLTARLCCLAIRIAMTMPKVWETALSRVPKVGHGNTMDTGKTFRRKAAWQTESNTWGSGHDWGKGSCWDRKGGSSPPIKSHFVDPQHWLGPCGHRYQWEDQCGPCSHHYRWALLPWTL